MRVYCIIDKTVFYHPQMVEAIFTDSRHQWVGLGVSPHDPLGKYLLRRPFSVGIRSGLSLFRQKYTLLLQGRFLSRTVTLRAVAEKYGVPWREVHNVNEPAFLQYLRSLEPDVIISSNSQIFQKDLLGIPKIACINRHSSLLPRHGGILPVFQAIAAGDQEVGVTVHVMEPSIDTGAIIAQAAIPLSSRKKLTDIYEKCFAVSAPLLLQALDTLEKSLPFQSLQVRGPASYHSFPTRQDWAAFTRNGGTFA